MKQKKVKVTALLLLGMGLLGVQAQEAIPATGGDATGTGGAVSYSIGQFVYTTNTGTNGSVAQGVQQPYEISIVTGMEEAKGIHLTVSAYPNPTTDFLTLRIENFELSTFNFQLFDMNGKLLESKKMTTNETTITLSHLPVATYFLNVSANNKEVKSFKIIKN